MAFLLLEELKNYLNITWDDQETIDKLNGIIIRGKYYLNNKAGVELDFENDYNAQQLLLDYGRYVYNHSFELFERNFKRELLALILHGGVKAREDSKKNTKTDS